MDLLPEGGYLQITVSLIKVLYLLLHRNLIHKQ